MSNLALIREWSRREFEARVIAMMNDTDDHHLPRLFDAGELGFCVFIEWQGLPALTRFAWFDEMETLP